MSNTNPLFDDAGLSTDDVASDNYLLPKNEHKLEPLAADNDRAAATSVIRKKLDKIYANEPDAETEITEVDELPSNQPPSKHQQFMHELSTSGKSLAEIQTAWHHYYVTLPDDEKHQVWQEFYASNARGSQYHQHTPKQPSVTVEAVLAEKGLAPEQPKVLAVHAAPKKRPAKTPDVIKRTILKHVTADGQLKAKHHFQSLLFGLGMGMVVIFIFLFGFFNEFFIAPFIQPSRHASATPLILNADSVAPTSTPEVIIPKINVEIPTDYTQSSTDENTIENALESGVVHYPTTVMPGQKGNAAFFGHSSNNIFNKGKYKFAFVLLHTLVPGDTFYLTNNGKVYVYQVITKDIVDPSDVGVLGPVAGQTATATLITCDPPGTSLHRLIIVGKQISPDPATNGTATTTAPAASNGPATTQQLPGNGPTLWTRFWRAVF